jgi:choline dehydrogenase-like flavoprotein
MPPRQTGPLPGTRPRSSWCKPAGGCKGLGSTYSDKSSASLVGCNHQVGLKIVGEMLPQERNRVTLAEDQDQYGLPVALVDYTWCDNDRALIGHSLGCMTRALQAIDATDIWEQTDDTCQLNGTARMGDDPGTGVVGADCRSWDIRNLWVCDGAVFPTVGGVSPSLTIQAIACRTG